MNGFRFCWCGLLTSLMTMAGSAEMNAPAPAPALTPVVVHGARINLRAKPAADAEPVGKVSEGTVLQAKSVREDWVEVVPPESVELWVYRDFIKDQTVTADRLYIRSGRSVNNSVVGTMERGAKVGVCGEFQDWLRIKPTPAASVWISRKFVEVQTAAPPTSVESGKVVPLPPPQAITTAATNAPAVPVPAVSGYLPADIKDALVPLAGQGAPVQMEGVLRVVGFGFHQPSRFRLVRLKGRSVETLCYVRGNSEQLNSLLDQRMQIQGRQYWVNGADSPVLIPERISPRAEP